MVILCQYCNKEYASYSSRSNHLKKFHSAMISQNIPNDKPHNKSNYKSIISHINKEIIDDLYQCNYCNNTYKHFQSRWKHEQKCKIKNHKKEPLEINEIKNENEKLKQEINDLKKTQKDELEKFKNDILKSIKIHPKTLQKINNQLNNNHINNGTVNNINIVQLGNENLEDILSSKEKLKILNKKGNSLKELVELVHISDKYTQFKNVYITNLQNTIGYKFDSKNNQFIAVNKSDLLDDIIDCRMCDIQTFYNELGTNFDEETKKIIQRFLDRMNDDDDKLKGLKKEEIKLLLYNSREKIQSTTQIEI